MIISIAHNFKCIVTRATTVHKIQLGRFVIETIPENKEPLVECECLLMFNYFIHKCNFRFRISTLAMSFTQKPRYVALWVGLGSA